MVAKIVGFRTREQLGLRKPRSFSRNITPGKGGAAVHWGGPAQTIHNHAECERTWRKWQNYHMDTHGWVDIAYTMGFCNHGYVFAGRGYGVRTAANGTNNGNQYFYAFVWIGGQGQKPTQAAYDALDWCIAEARRAGGAGREVRPHRTFTGSSCPGPDLIAHGSTRHLRDIPTTEETTEPTPQEEEMSIKPGAKGPAVALLQRCLINEELAQGHDNPLPQHGANGDYNKETVEGVKAYQKAAGIEQTGELDGVTVALLLRYEHG